MNKRIRELAEQAGMVKILEEHAHEYGNGTFENTPYPELEKVAELIIRECVAQCEKNAEHPYLGPGSKLSAFNIKEHFGVEG